MYVCLCFSTLDGESPELSGGSNIDVVGTIMRGLFWGLCDRDVEGVAGESGGGVGGDGAANGVDAGAKD